jgi:hypothetical protein
MPRPKELFNVALPPSRNTSQCPSRTTTLKRFYSRETVPTTNLLPYKAQIPHQSAIDRRDSSYGSSESSYSRLGCRRVETRVDVPIVQPLDNDSSSHQQW